MRLTATFASALALAAATALTPAAASPRTLPTTRPLAECSGPMAAVFAPGVVSRADKEEYRITFTRDDRTAYFSRADVFFPFSRQATIYETHWTGGAWSVPVPASFSGTYSDIDPWISSDGQRLYFSSIRPVDGQARDDLDVWFVERLPGGGWGPARHAGAVNEPGVTGAGEPVDELYPTVGSDGWLYTGSNRDGGEGGWDLWRAAPRPDGTFGPAENLGPVTNTAGWEFNPTFAPNGRHLVFTQIAEFAPPWGELHAARVTDGEVPGSAVAVGEPQRLTVVDTDADEFHASFSGDGRTFFFLRNALTETSTSDVHCLPTKGLDLP